MVMLSKRIRMNERNLYKRLKRRYAHETDYEERTCFKDEPTLSEIKEALRESTDSHETIIRLAALMDNLAMYNAPMVLMGNSKARTSGIRKVLEKDGYLLSRYSSLMRYKALAGDIRRYARLDVCPNLLWGLEPTCPDDGEESAYEVLRNLYASFKGMNFKQIKAKLKEDGK